MAMQHETGIETRQPRGGEASNGALDTAHNIVRGALNGMNSMFGDTGDTGTGPDINGSSDPEKGPGQLSRGATEIVKKLGIPPKLAWDIATTVSLVEQPDGSAYRHPDELVHIEPYIGTESGDPRELGRLTIDIAPGETDEQVRARHDAMKVAAEMVSMWTGDGSVSEEEAQRLLYIGTATKPGLHEAAKYISKKELFGATMWGMCNDLVNNPDLNVSVLSTTVTAEGGTGYSYANVDTATYIDPFTGWRTVITAVRYLDRGSGNVVGYIVNRRELGPAPTERAAA